MRHAPGRIRLSLEQTAPRRPRMSPVTPVRRLDHKRCVIAQRPPRRFETPAGRCLAHSGNTSENDTSSSQLRKCAVKKQPPGFFSMAGEHVGKRHRPPDELWFPFERLNMACQPFGTRRPAPARSRGRERNVYAGSHHATLPTARQPGNRRHVEQQIRSHGRPRPLASHCAAQAPDQLTGNAIRPFKTPHSATLEAQTPPAGQTHLGFRSGGPGSASLVTGRTGTAGRNVAALALVHLRRAPVATHLRNAGAMTAFLHHTTPAGQPTQRQNRRLRPFRLLILFHCLSSLAQERSCSFKPYRQHGCSETSPAPLPAHRTSKAPTCCQACNNSEPGTPPSILNS